jgi:hypothetical protein
MSKSILTMQVPPQPPAPRGASALGTCAAVLFVTLRDMARAISVARTPRQERRHA